MASLFQQGDSLFWSHEHELLQIEPWGRDSLRVRATQNQEIQTHSVDALLPQERVEGAISRGETGARLRNGAITAEISEKGNIRFLHTQTGKELLAEEPATHATRIPARAFTAREGDFYHLEARFQAYADERLYGLGQHQHGLLNQKGATIDLVQRNTEVSIPFLFSSRGYGLLWNNPAIGRVELGMTRTRWIAEVTSQLDYWITAGDTPAEIMQHYANATGYAPAFPDWASGFWQSKLRYASQQELLAIAREYKRRKLPLDVIVIDFFHWSLQGEWRFDPEYWPDPAAMVSELRSLGVEVMVSIWPTVNPASEYFTHMHEKGLLIRSEHGMAPLMSFQDNKATGPVYLHYYDATNPAARDFIWSKVHEHYYQYGIRAWWLDACEPEIYLMHPEDLRLHQGSGAAIANAYPMLHTRGFYEHTRAAGEAEPLNLCRSAWAGSQRYGAAVWSGDIDSTFAALQTQVRAGLNMAMSGIPWWTTDIGGFYGANIHAPAFRELVVRWFQYGAFCPLFRLHGYRDPQLNYSAMINTGDANEVWSFGEEAYTIIREYLFLRERLRPYIQEQMDLAHRQGIPPMRPLFFDFPTDATGSEIDDQFLFGPDLLVAPVLTEGARSRQVYLPSGVTWTDAWTGQTCEGGSWQTASAPLEQIPLYLKGQARLPLLGTNV